MNQQTQASPKNRTTVRSYPWTVRAVFAGLRAVSNASPRLASHLALPLMFRTRRARVPNAETRVLSSATPFSLGRGVSRLQGWRWGEGPPVILVHGWNGRGSQLGAFVQPLCDRGYQVVTFDATGHGASAGDESSLVAVADALDRVIEHVRPMHGAVEAIIAHSMGGAATTYAMGRFHAKTDREIERALQTHRLPSRKFVFVAPPTDVRDFVRGFTRVVGLDPSTEHLLRERIAQRFQINLEALHAPTIARSLRAPLLVIHDESDREVPIEKGRELAAAWPNSEFIATSGLGHSRILQNPDVIDHVVSFVTRE